MYFSGSEPLPLSLVLSISSLLHCPTTACALSLCSLPTITAQTTALMLPCILILYLFIYFAVICWAPSLSSVAKLCGYLSLLTRVLSHKNKPSLIPAAAAALHAGQTTTTTRCMHCVFIMNTPSASFIFVIFNFYHQTLIKMHNMPNNHKDYRSPVVIQWTAERQPNSLCAYVRS